MKKVWIVVLCFVLLISCSTDRFTSIQGEISFEKGEPPDSIYVSIYQPRLGLSLGEPLMHYVLTEPIFKLKINPGLYKIAIYAKGYQTIQENIFIQSDQDVFLIDAVMQVPYTHIPVQNVELLGSFNDWDVNEKIPLKKEGANWIFDNTSILTSNEDYYAFRVDGLRCEDLSNPYYTKSTEYADISSLYKGGRIVFDPSLYLHEKIESSVEFPDSPLQSDYLSLTTALDGFQKNMYAPVMRNPNFGGDALKKHHQMLVHQLDSLERAYDVVFLSADLGKAGYSAA